MIEYFDAHYGCNEILASSANALNSMFCEVNEVFQSYVKKENSFGAFYDTTSQLTWLIDITRIGQAFRVNDVVDSGTREMKLFVITRNEEDNDWFYSLVEIKMVFKSDGNFRVTYDPTFIPIIQVCCCSIVVRMFQNLQVTKFIVFLCPGWIPLEGFIRIFI